MTAPERRECPCGCGESFVPAWARQRYLNPTHADRHRKRRERERMRQELEAPPQSPGEPEFCRCAELVEDEPRQPQPLVPSQVPTRSHGFALWLGRRIEATSDERWKLVHYRDKLPDAKRVAAALAIRWVTLHTGGGENLPDDLHRPNRLEAMPIHGREVDGRPACFRCGRRLPPRSEPKLSDAERDFVLAAIHRRTLALDDVERLMIANGRSRWASTAGLIG